jgi:phosphatidylinositol glycan class M
LLTLVPPFGAGCGRRKDFDFCIALQTMAFVAFNKVVTAQYFVWYMALLPTALLAADVSWRELAVAGAAWAVCELHWLAWAYRVEFLGESAFEGVFVAGLLFFAVNVALIGGLMRRWKAELLQVGPAPQGRAEGRTTRGKKQR